MRCPTILTYRARICGWARGAPGHRTRWSTAGRDERRAFRTGTFPDVSRTGDLEDVGHYTQMVWRNTGQVGCAMASNRSMDYLVCRYARTGNVEGERVY